MKRNMSLILAVIIGIITNTATSCSNGQDRNSSENLKAMNDSIVEQLENYRAVEQKEELNKVLVTNMYQELFGDKNIDAADKYIVENYIQHNPSAADGRAALKEALKTWFKNAPKEKIDIQRIAADGDLVFIHTRSKMGDKTFSIIDIFRIEGDMVAEHWDVIQEVPAKAANDHPMF
jgi:predicted SnoaL-like aldol condensation-catalyzing enzyme